MGKCRQKRTEILLWQKIIVAGNEGPIKNNKLWTSWQNSRNYWWSAANGTRNNLSCSSSSVFRLSISLLFESYLSMKNVSVYQSMSGSINLWINLSLDQPFYPYLSKFICPSLSIRSKAKQGDRTGLVTIGSFFLRPIHWWNSGSAFRITPKRVWMPLSIQIAIFLYLNIFFNHSIQFLFKCNHAESINLLCKRKYYCMAIEYRSFSWKDLFTTMAAI